MTTATRPPVARRSPAQRLVAMASRPTGVPGLRAAKASYFLFFVNAAAYAPYIALVYRDRGYSGSVTGWLAAAPMLLGVVAGPVLGAVADTHRRHLALLRLSLAGMAATLAAIAFAPGLAWLVPAVVAYAIAFTPVLPLIDSGVVTLLGDRAEEYGFVRLWGTFGWGAASPVVAWMVGRWGTDAIFVVAVVASLACLGAAWRLPVSGGAERPAPGAMAALARDRHLWRFLGVGFLGGVGISVLTTYLLVYLEDIGATSTQLGLALVFATVGEIPAMLLAHRVLRRLGAGPVMLAGLVLFAVRAAAFTAIGVPWLALLVQVLHGPAFTAVWVGGVTLVRVLVPEGLGATAQSLFAMAVMGLGGATGSILGGALLDVGGTDAVFALACGAIAAALVLAVARGGRQGAFLRRAGSPAG